MSQHDHALAPDLDLLLSALADAVALRLSAQLELRLKNFATTPWMGKAEALAYTGLARGTFEKMAADGRIPSHGGKTKVFHRDELDQALLGM